MRSIIGPARDIRAHRLFADQRRLAGLRAEALATLAGVDALLFPTTTEHPTIAEVAEYLRTNARPRDASGCVVRVERALPAGQPVRRPHLGPRTRPAAAGAAER